MSFYLGDTSKKRLYGVHPKLIATVERALSYNIIDLTVVPYGGCRTEAQQRELVNKGASKTMKSMHLPQADGYGHAVDVAPYPVDWNNIQRFMLASTIMFKAAAEEGLLLQWGGHWRKFKDYPHFQIDRIL